MLNKLKVQMQGAYAPEQVAELEEMENLLHVDHFNSGDALKLGNQIVSEAKKYGGEMAAVVTTSGLRDGMDHMAVLGALRAVRGCGLPAFHGKYV